MTTLSIVKNEKFNSYELTFSEKPAAATLELLKANKYRWNPYKKIWYGFSDISALLNSEKPETKKEKKTAVNIAGFVVGDILYSSWGYDQTNIDFYQVIKVTEKTITVKEISYNLEQAESMSGYKKPIKNSFVDDLEYTRKVITTDKNPISKAQYFIRLNKSEYCHIIEPGKKYFFSEWA